VIRIRDDEQVGHQDVVRREDDVDRRVEDFTDRSWK